MKKICSFLFCLFVLKNVGFAQQADTVKPIKIAVFAPLYLDSTFGTKGYKYGKLVPPFAIPGVEYLYGAYKAIDSLKKTEQNISYSIFDSKSTVKNIGSLIANGDLANMDMFIGSVSGMDVKVLADYALKMGKPFISATYPNDATVTNNPNFVILNSTLKTNCAALHQFLRTKLKDQRIVLLAKEGKQEERITNYFKDFEKNSDSSSLAINYVNLGSDLTEQNIVKNFDSTVLSTYIIASTDVAFAKTVAQALVKHNLQEQSNMVGLPTWDDAAEFNKKEYKNLYFYYVTPMAKPTNPLAVHLGNNFKAKYGSIAGDNIYRGYESIYKYTKLLIKHQQNILSNLNDKMFSNFSNYDLQPVMLNPNNMALDYFENKKVYLLKRFNGEVKPIAQ